MFSENFCVRISVLHTSITTTGDTGFYYYKSGYDEIFFFFSLGWGNVGYDQRCLITWKTRTFFLIFRFVFTVRNCYDYIYDFNYFLYKHYIFCIFFLSPTNKTGLWLAGAQRNFTHELDSYSGHIFISFTIRYQRSAYLLVINKMSDWHFEGYCG